jgi:outer membrane protein OmpA-like peptidoglycan-associated protein
MNKLSIAVLLILTVCLPGSGQKIAPSPVDLYADVLEYIYAGEYNEALPVLMSLQEKGYATANISYLIGECFLNIPGQKNRAIPYLKEASQKISGTYTGQSLEEEFAPVKSLLYLGIAYRLNDDFTHAIDCLNTYIRSIDDVEVDNKALAEFHIERCKNALVLMASPTTFSVDTLPDAVNSAVSNFNPVVTRDEKVIYYMNQLKFYDAVMHAVKVDTTWQVPDNLTPAIRSDGDHYITGMSADGTRLYLTCYDPYRSGEIYTTVFKDGQWSTLTRLNDKINTIFNETHASPSPDGKYLYFTSDRKGGYGGLDIYRSSLTDAEEWDEPVNLGPQINSPFNEESPFVSSNAGKLFFSSQGHYNMGGYDIFVSSPDAYGNWLPPVNIGYPLSTTDDDLFFFPLGTGNMGYHASISHSSGGMDIVRYDNILPGRPFRYTLNGRINIQADPGYDQGNIRLAVTDKTSGSALPVITLEHDGSFSQKLSGGSYRLDFSDPTRVLLSRELEIPDYFPGNELVLIADITVPSILPSDTVVLRDIRFAFDRSGLDDQYLGYLDSVARFMAEYPGLNLQINGYADSRGKESYNDKLSLFRAQAVKQYLQGNDTLAGRISVTAFGEKDPVAVNVNSNGTDNPAGRSYNRRTELVLTNIPAQLVVIRNRDIPEDLLSR